MFWQNRIFFLLSVGFQLVLLLNYFVQLLQLVLDHLLTHRISYSVSVDEDMVRQLSVVVISESLERVLEVSLKHSRTDDLLSLLTLWTRLSVILAEVLVVGGAETNNALLSFVTDVDSDKHGLL